MSADGLEPAAHTELVAAVADGGSADQPDSPGVGGGESGGEGREEAERGATRWCTYSGRRATR